MAAGKGGNAKVDREEALKAVVLADSFNQLFQPLALNKPRCLLPLCNVPMFEYTLEFLASSGVEEAYVICQAHADKLKAYIRKSKWGRGHSPLKVIVKVVQGANSVGDALREVDSSSVIRSDFILCTGVVVSNMDLTSVMAAHMARKQKDKNQIMTVLVQETTASHRVHDKTDESVCIMDPRTNQLLAVHSSAAVPRHKYMDIQTEVITTHDEVELRADLVDTHVAICSLEALALFTENFDYQTMMRDFVRGILTSDLLSSTIYAHVLLGSSSMLAEKQAAALAGTPATTSSSLLATGNPAALGDSIDDELLLVEHSGYAAAVTDTAAYDAISRDLIGRWAYPLCPDSNPLDTSAYTYNRGAVYKSSHVVLGRESRVEHRVVLGPHSHVADFAIVSDSVLGPACTVAEGAAIHGSYLFDSVRVGRNSIVERAILGERVTILENVVIERGCILGDDVTIGPNITVPAFTRIARKKRQVHNGFSDSDFSSDEDDAEFEDSEDDDDADTEIFDARVVGAQGVGYVWDESDDDAWDDDDAEDTRNTHLHHIGARLSDLTLAPSELADDPPTEFEDSDAESDVLELDSGIASELTDLHLGQPSDSKARAMQEDFVHELGLTLDRSFDEGHDVGVTALEMNTLRMAFDGNLDLMRATVVRKVLSSADPHALPSSLKTVVAKWAELIRKNIYSNMDQIDVVDITERYCATSSSVDDDVRARLFAFAVRFLYEFDVVEDLTVIAWYNRALKADDDAVDPELVSVIQRFVEWLSESDEESDEESDDDSE